MVRKILSSIVSTFLSTFFLVCLLSINEDHVIGVSVFIAPVVFVVTLIYGVPTSILIGRITKKMQGKIRAVVTLIYFLLFGVLFVAVITLVIYVDYFDSLSHVWNETHFYFISAVVSSISFWLTELFFATKIKNNG